MAPRTVRHRLGVSGALLLAGALILCGCASSTVTAAAHVHRLPSTTSATSTFTTRPRPRATTRAVPATTSTSEPATTTPATAPPTTAAPTAFTTTPTALAAPPPPLAQPTAAHPLTILEIGDSIGVDLGLGMADVLASDPYVHLVQAAVGDTGLARPDYYNWPAHLAQELAAHHPGVVVVMLGGKWSSRTRRTPSRRRFGAA